MASIPAVLVCFAVPEEADCFTPPLRTDLRIDTLVTGMGARNACTALEPALTAHRPQLVLTCGFAGGLKPGLAAGTIVYAADAGNSLGQLLRARGAVLAEMHCASRVATTAGEKRALRESTGADVVEMESGVIREICRRRGVVSATIRVVTDAVDEDLPIDFNAFLTEEQELDYGKLVWALIRNPVRIRGLLRLRRRTQAAARTLAQTLHELLCSWS